MTSQQTRYTPACISFTVDSWIMRPPPSYPSEWEGNSQLGLPVRSLHQITFLHQSFSNRKNNFRSGLLCKTEEKKKWMYAWLLELWKYFQIIQSKRIIPEVGDCEKLKKTTFKYLVGYEKISLFFCVCHCHSWGRNVWFQKFAEGALREAKSAAWWHKSICFRTFLEKFPQLRFWLLWLLRLFDRRQKVWNGLKRSFGPSKLPRAL